MAHAVTVAAGAFFLVSGLSKIRRYSAFRRALRGYGLWTKNLSAAAWAWIALEAGVGAWLLLSPIYRFVPFAGVLGLATGAMGRRVRQGVNHDCGCSAKPHLLSWRLIVKNLTLVAVGMTVSQWIDGPSATGLAAVTFGLGAVVGAGTVGHPAGQLATQGA